MITVDANNQTELESTSGGAVIFWVDIFTQNYATPGSSRTSYRFYTEAYTGLDFAHTFDTSIDFAGAYLLSPPDFNRAVDKISSAKIEIAIVDPNETFASSFVSAWIANDFIGADLAWGMFLTGSSSSTKHVMLDKGRCFAVELNDESIMLECLGTSENMRGQVPKWDINLEQWVCVVDAQNNPDQTNPWQQGSALATPSGYPTYAGRWRKGNQYGPADLDWVFPHPVDVQTRRDTGDLVGAI